MHRETGNLGDRSIERMIEDLARQYSRREVLFDYDDLIQEARLRLILVEKRLPESEARAYVRVVIRNRFNDLMRREKRHKEILMSVPRATESVSDSPAHDFLTEDQRIFAKLLISGHPPSDAAKEMQISYYTSRCLSREIRSQLEHPSAGTCESS